MTGGAERLTKMLTGDGNFGAEKNRRGLGKTPFGGRIALNVSPTFRPAAQSVPRREFCFRSCIRKAYELNQFPTARSAARRWFYADPQSRAQIGIHFGDATDSLIAKVHYRSIRMESQITRMDTTGIGCAQKNTDRQIHDRVCLSVLLSERAAPLARIRRAARRLAGDSLSQLSTCPGAYYISGCNVAAMSKPRPREQGRPSESREFVTEQARGNTTQTARRDMQGTIPANTDTLPASWLNPSDAETGGCNQTATMTRRYTRWLAPYVRHRAETSLTGRFRSNFTTVRNVVSTRKTLTYRAYKRGKTSGA